MTKASIRIEKECVIDGHNTNLVIRKNGKTGIVTLESVGDICKTGIAFSENEFKEVINLIKEFDEVFG